MRNKKINLDEMQGKLTRTEMKKIKGGDKSIGDQTSKCCVGNQCTACVREPNCGSGATEVSC